MNAYNYCMKTEKEDYESIELLHEDDRNDDNEMRGSRNISYRENASSTLIDEEPSSRPKKPGNVPITV